MFHGIILPGLFFWWIFGHGIGSIVGLILVIWLVSTIFHPWRRWHYGHPYYDPRGPASSALNLLEERYARGEIQRDEYLQKRNDILNRSA